MNYIKLRTSTVDKDMKRALRILVEGSNRDVEKLLPLQLNRVKETAEECKNKINLVVNRYQVVIDTLQELRGAVLTEQGKTEEAQLIAQQEEEKADLKKAKVSREQQEMEMRMQKIEQQIVAAEKNLREAKAKASAFEGRRDEDIDNISASCAAIGASVLGPVGGAVGSMVGGLFRSKKNPYQDEVVKSLEQLSQAQQRADEAFNTKREINQEHLEVVQALAGLQMDLANHEEILTVIRQALVAFGDLQEKWNELLQFFTAIATLIDLALSKPMLSFCEEVKQMRENKLDGHEITNFHKEMLSDPLMESTKVASLVYYLSSTYCTISQEYLMPMVGSLGKLIAMDKDSQKEAIAEARNDLLEKASLTHRYINEVVARNRESYTKQLDKKKDELENLLQ
jgi:chromosome segregation ATPase